MFNAGTAYTDPQWFEAEKREIFRRLPLMVGLSRDIPQPGDKLLFDAVGPSILVVRDKDHRVHAYLNMCPHRATKLVQECRRSSLITCPFHGWTFDLQGKLVGLPGSESFAGIERAQLGLIRVPVVERHGMIFVVARPGSEPIDIDEYVGPLGDKLAIHDFARCKPIRKGRYDPRGNWKYTVDTFGEGYHVGTLHPKTVGPIVIQDMVTYDEMAPHHIVGFPRKTLLKDIAKPPTEWEESPLALAVLLFPNTIIQIQGPSSGPTYVFYHMFPGDNAYESFTLVETYRSGEIPEEADTAPYEAEHNAQQVVVATEDYTVASSAQANLEHAPEGFRIVYGSNEVSLQRFHRQVAKLIGRQMST